MRLRKQPHNSTVPWLGGLAATRVGTDSKADTEIKAPSKQPSEVCLPAHSQAAQALLLLWGEDTNGAPDKRAACASTELLVAQISCGGRSRRQEVRRARNTDQVGPQP